MKKIISAIDFSKCSVHALEYAIQIANEVGADVTMVWVDTSTTGDYEMSIFNRELRYEVKSQFLELMEKYQPMMKSGELSFKLRKGKVYQELANHAKYDDADLLVAGSHGVSGFEKYWIGSNANKIVSYSPCPVITMRFAYPIKGGIGKIVIPIDSTLETRQKIPFTVKLARIFGSEIHILAIYTSTVLAVQRKVDSYVQQTIAYMRKEGLNFVVEAVQADNITNSIIKYAESVDADLISIMTEQETSAANLLLGPYAHQMVNNSSIPVLTLQAEEIMKVHAGN
ncbi:MAG: universal stress protein [Bacteroidetes bacterium]|nr:universal stress protein [Bacteroidota bacterium]